MGKFVVVYLLSVSYSLWPHGLQHTRLLCPPVSPRVCLNLCPLSPWCYVTILSAIPFSFCFQSFPASGLFHWVRNGEIWKPLARGCGCSPLLTPSPVTRQQLPSTISSTAPPLVHACQKTPPKSNQFQWATISGPLQPLITAIVGPSHKQPTVSERPLVVPFVGGIVVLKQRVR